MSAQISDGRPFFDEALAKRMDNVLGDREVSLRRVLAATGIARGTWKNLPSTPNPRLSTFEVLAVPLAVNPDWLRTGKGDVEPQSDAEFPPIEKAPISARTAATAILRRGGQSESAIRDALVSIHRKHWHRRAATWWFGALMGGLHRPAAFFSSDDLFSDASGEHLAARLGLTMTHLAKVAVSTPKLVAAAVSQMDKGASPESVRKAMRFGPLPLSEAEWEQTISALEAD